MLGLHNKLTTRGFSCGKCGILFDQNGCGKRGLVYVNQCMEEKLMNTSKTCVGCAYVCDGCDVCHIVKKCDKCRKRNQYLKFANGEWVGARSTNCFDRSMTRLTVCDRYYISGVKTRCSINGCVNMIVGGISNRVNYMLMFNKKIKTRALDIQICRVCCGRVVKWLNDIVGPAEVVGLVLEYALGSFLNLKSYNK